MGLMERIALQGSISSARADHAGQQKRKRAKNRKPTGSSSRPRAAGAAAGKARRRKPTTRRKRKVQQLQLSGLRRRRRQARSASSTSTVLESDSTTSCPCCKRPCTSSSWRSGEEHEQGDEGGGVSHSFSKSGSFQDSIPGTKQISPDASQLNPAFEQWDLNNMAQAIHEPLEALGQFEPPGVPPAPSKPQEKPRGTATSGPYPIPMSETLMSEATLDLHFGFDIPSVTTL